MSDAPPPRPFPLQAGHPANHGYATCDRCKTQRPKGGLLFVGDAPPVCVDTAWCSRQAGVGLGKLDGGPT